MASDPPRASVKSHFVANAVPICAVGDQNIRKEISRRPYCRRGDDKGKSTFDGKTAQKAEFRNFRLSRDNCILIVPPTTTYKVSNKFPNELRPRQDTIMSAYSGSRDELSLETAGSREHSEEVATTPHKSSSSPTKPSRWQRTVRKVMAIASGFTTAAETMLIVPRTKTNSGYRTSQNHRSTITSSRASRQSGLSGVGQSETDFFAEPQNTWERRTQLIIARAKHKQELRSRHEELAQMSSEDFIRYVETECDGYKMSGALPEATAPESALTSDGVVSTEDKGIEEDDYTGSGIPLSAIITSSAASEAIVEDVTKLKTAVSAAQFIECGERSYSASRITKPFPTMESVLDEIVTEKEADSSATIHTPSDDLAAWEAKTFGDLDDRPLSPIKFLNESLEEVEEELFQPYHIGGGQFIKMKEMWWKKLSKR